MVNIYGKLTMLLFSQVCIIIFLALTTRYHRTVRISVLNFLLCDIDILEYNLCFMSMHVVFFRYKLFE
jgi:hypothetical protein